MPKTKVIFYRESTGEAPVIEFLKKLKDRDEKGWANCVAKIEMLADYGHELRRPAADTLRDGILELRAKHHTVQYRILYFFDGKNIAILAHSLIKKGNEVDPGAIEKAIEKKKNFKTNPKMHTYVEEVD